MLQPSSASTPKLEWFVSTQRGHGAARVSAGLRIGEDETGDIVFNPEPSMPAVILEVGEDGTLSVQAIPSGNEFELPRGRRIDTLTIVPGSGARIHFSHSIIRLRSSLSVTGSFRNELVVATLLPRQAHGNPLPAGPQKLEAADEQALEAPTPDDSEFELHDPLQDAMILAEPQADSEEPEEPGEPGEPEEPIPTLEDVILGNEIDETLLPPDETEEEAEAIILPEPLRTPGAEPAYAGPSRSLELSVYERPELAASPEPEKTGGAPVEDRKRRWPAALLILAVVIGAIAVSLTTLRRGAELSTAGPRAASVTPPAAQTGTMQQAATASTLLASVNSLVEAPELPDAVTREFVVTTLNALVTTDASGEANRMLETFTTRLALEAETAAAAGDVTLAAGLLAQAEASTRPTETLVRVRRALAPGADVVGAHVAQAAQVEDAQEAPQDGGASQTVAAAPVSTLTQERSQGQTGGRTETSEEEARLLAEAEALYRRGAILEPADRNAVGILTKLLKQNPDNEAAMALMFDCTVVLLEAAREVAEAGDAFQARNIVEEVLAFHPQQPDALLLWEQLVGRPYRRSSSQPPSGGSQTSTTTSASANP